MKKQMIILTCLLLTACTDENMGALYDDASGAGFAFAAQVLNVEASPEDGNEILVPVYRTNTNVNVAEISFEYDVADNVSSDPEWEAADPNEMFSLTTQRVIFPDGMYMAYARIRYRDIEQLDPMGKYRMRLKIKGNLSPSNRDEVIITAGRRLTFEFYSKCYWYDSCVFMNPYEIDLYKAVEGEIYRAMDPYTEGLNAEDFAAEGWMLNPPEYVQFVCDKDGNITYEPFRTGMLVYGLYMAYAYYPGEYQWGRDFSNYNKENKKLSDKEFQLYPVYCLPEYSYGFLDEGVFKLTITLK